MVLFEAGDGEYAIEMYRSCIKEELIQRESEMEILKIGFIHSNWWNNEISIKTLIPTLKHKPHRRQK